MFKLTTKTKAMLASWLKVFLAAVVSAFLVIVGATQSIPTAGEAWLSILVAGILAVGPVVYNYLSPKDTRYGRGAVE